MARDRGWKQFERRCCRDFGTERTPVTGERHGADGTSDMFAFQFKLRATLPDWLFEWLNGIVCAAIRCNKIGVLILKTPRMEDGESLVVMRYRDWVDLHGTTTYAEQPHRVEKRERQQAARREKAS